MKRLITFALYLTLTGLVLTLAACTKEPQKPRLSFYHWANTYNADPALETRFTPKNLYVKLLDIAYRKRLVVHTTRFKSPMPANTRPVAYIDNRAMQQASVDDLLKAIVNAIPPDQFNYLQMDCDWTGSTREPYFELLDRLGRHYQTVTATIRLHQLKYFSKTGVPPVKKGILMYYNMSNVRDITISNYVLDNDVGRRYLGAESYPLPLDLALPLYQQTRLIRQNKLVRLLPSVKVETDKLKQIGPDQYKVLLAHYWQGEYLYKNDILALDKIDESTLIAAANALSPHLRPEELIFYRLRDARRFPDATFDRLIDMFAQ